jgi:hypothetical protein
LSVSPLVHPSFPLQQETGKKDELEKIVKHHYSVCATTKCRQSVKSESVQNRQKKQLRDEWVVDGVE